jgi:pyruvate/2-oxoglutarate dehydrogenase complex dihydrolipoamide dehydrogenase (E3) component
VEGVKMHTYDLLVIGGGSGGYAAARTARELGASVGIVDAGPLGGLCILRGCMPSKTLLASGDAAHQVRAAAALGVYAGEPRIDLPAIVERKRRLVAGFAGYRTEQLERFPVHRGAARFLSPTEVAVGNDEIVSARHIVVATGSVNAPPVVPGLAEAGYIDSDAALELERLPKSLVVFGGGYVASELGQYFSRLGVRTTMLLRSGHLLTGEDDDIGDALTSAFRDEGIRIETRAKLVRVERDGERKVVHYAQDGAARTVAADEIFYALGRLPNVAHLDLELAGVRYHNMTGIEAGPDLRTTAPNIFAVGDVLGTYPLVHVAIYQGELAARNALLGTHEAADYALQKAHTTFTDPQVAIAGDSEKELQRSGTPYLAASYRFDDHGKAIAINRTKGFVKMMASPGDGRILGAAVVGPEGSDLIHELIVALAYRATVHDFMKIPHLHPTLAEIWTYPAEELDERIRAAPLTETAAV